ncbi:Zinc finger, CCHC-type domain-containing protein [Strongyloides ratti]|uniref:Zinc finger, CCHC-type domain-containing protein n=1 Tax=Strongyloides ratti TaxID=34506 RepID=A0A090KVA3_STRRB|nr:Zinc finger, CCHC-type domain-containing protein [Strongyloides ratti]CEF61346.1 Zinc finger, CCHC-type domain-containing protein [Strongyloides ratti]
MGLQSLAEYPLSNPGMEPSIRSFDECIRMSAKVLDREMLSEEEREAYNEEIRNIFKTILAKPKGNIFGRTFEEICETYKYASYKHVVNLTRETIIKTAQKHITTTEQETIKQKVGEPVSEYTKRFYEAMYACMPGLELKVLTQEEPGEGTNDWGNKALRQKLYGNFMNGLLPSIVEKIPLVPVSQHYLKNIVEQAHTVEAMIKHRGVYGGKVAAVVEGAPNNQNGKKSTKNAACYNCDKKGHRASECRNVVVTCAICGKAKHLAKYCFKNNYRE